MKDNDTKFWYYTSWLGWNYHRKKTSKLKFQALAFGQREYQAELGVFHQIKPEPIWLWTKRKELQNQRLWSKHVASRWPHQTFLVT